MLRGTCPGLRAAKDCENGWNKAADVKSSGRKKDASEQRDVKQAQK